MPRNIQSGPLVKGAMDRRLTVVICSVAIAFMAIALTSLVVPGRTFACTCAPPSSLAEAAADPSQAIVLATIGGSRGNGKEIAVEGSFGPVVLGDTMIVSGFGPQGAACQHGGATGQRWIFVLYRSQDGIYNVNSCLLSGQIGTDAGNALLLDAVTAFGEPGPPSTSDPQPQAPA